MTPADPVEILRELVAFDTTSRNSNLALLEWIAERAESAGAVVRYTRSDDGCKANALISMGPVDVPGIVLSGHTDVVPVDGQAWSSDPFTLRDDGDRLYGRGTSDMKGFIACCVAALPQWSEQPLCRPIHLALSYDEEVGCLGVPRLIADMLDHVARPEFIIVGEPTGMKLATAHKGFCLYSTIFDGEEAHSSLSHLGRSAIAPAVRFANFLLETGSLLAYRTTAVPGMVPNHTTFNIGQLEGGTAINIIAGRCRVTWEFRAVPDEDVAAIKGRIANYLRNGPVNEGKVTHQELLEVPPLMTDPTQAAVEWLKRFLQTDETISVPFGTEAGFFARQGLPALVCGPGSIAQAHRPDEWIEKAQLRQCMRLMQHVGSQAWSH
jgi:acetylornithine deacetylase